MKSILYLSLILLALSTVYNCKKEPLKVAPTVTINAITDITSQSASSGGNVTSDGGATVTARGICFSSTNLTPTISDGNISNGGGLGSFTSLITGLSAGTTYYVIAYATNSIGTSYSSVLSFKTLALAPSITTSELTNITTTTATSGGNITNDGGAPVTARGVCWSTKENPTMADNMTSDGTGIGSFTSSITSLSSGATYYFRAYATNSIGTSYGNQVSTKILATIATLTATSVTYVTTISATLESQITTDGGAPVTAKGVCWSTKENPSIADNKTMDGTGIGNFTSSITNLVAGTTYYFKAYATNSIGTSYGNQVTTKTLATLATLTAKSVTYVSAISATLVSDITNDGGASIISKGVCWSTNPNPTISDNKTTDGTGSGSFTGNISGLKPNTNYFVRAYATNNAGISYSNELTFNTLPLKNYLQTSYELQKSNVSIDLMALRAKYGVNSGWNIWGAFLDINGDGYDDIFYNESFGTADRTDGKIFIYKDGSYIPDNSYFTTPPSLVLARKAIVGDYNGDSIPDIFIAASGDDRPPFAGEYTELLLSNSNKKYDLVKFTDKVGYYHSACSGDIDNDGDLDIFVLGDENTYVLINDGKGNFTYSTVQIDLNSLKQQFHCELIDIDKDGYLDLIMGGHEFVPNITTKIYWGSSSHKYSVANMTIIPAVVNWGVITDLDIYDLDNDGSNEVLITRSGGRVNDFNYIYFYSGWYIQVVKLNNRTAVDLTNSYIENNIYTQNVPDNQQWIPWMRFGDFDNNGKIDFFSVKCTNLPMVRWELQNKKLIRIF